MGDTLSKVSVKDIIEALKIEGLVLVPKTYMDSFINVKEAQLQALTTRHISSYRVAKLKLINGITTNLGVKQLMKRDFVLDQDYYIDDKGIMQVLTSTIKTLRNG